MSVAPSAASTSGGAAASSQVHSASSDPLTRAEEVEAVPTSVVAEVLGRKPQSLSPARDSLMKKGLVYSGERGRIAFTVPHFGRYLRAQT